MTYLGLKQTFLQGQGVSLIDIDAQGNFVEKQGTLITTKTESYNGIHYEYNDYFDLPIILSKKWNINEHFSVYTKAGFELSLFELHSGSVLSDDLIFENIKDSNSPYFNQKNRISYIFGSGINFTIHDFPFSWYRYINRKSEYRINTEIFKNDQHAINFLWYKF